jgi:dihydropteroate synthase
MGILNVTPDSFSDGGRFVNREAAIHQVETMLHEGADIIDIGGESTRPGASDVTVTEEAERVVPVITAIREISNVPISVDTSKAEVMRVAVAAGADMINDVRALQDDGALEAAVELQTPVCLMHMQGLPRTMQENPVYEDVAAEVVEFLLRRIDACSAAGLPDDLIVVDPGFGFGKSHVHNIELLANLRQLQELRRPVMVGLSRKSTLGALTGKGTDDRTAASVAAAVLAVAAGAQIVRVHDVAETVDALKVTTAVMGTRRQT